MVGGSKEKDIQMTNFIYKKEICTEINNLRIMSIKQRSR